MTWGAGMDNPTRVFGEDAFQQMDLRCVGVGQCGEAAAEEEEQRLDGLGGGTHECAALRRLVLVQRLAQANPGR